MKILNGKELAGFVKERQAAEVRSLQAKGVLPKLIIIRDSDNPVIVKYVNLKIRYGQDIGVKVEDILVGSTEEAKAAIISANQDKSVSGIIVQLPLISAEKTDEVVSLIAPEKDVDGLSGGVEDLRMVHGEDIKPAGRPFDSATATAINWLLTGYDIDLTGKKIALVGRGRLVGAPLYRMFKNSGLNVTVFGHNGDLSQLCDFDVVISATGVAHLIKPKMIRPGAVVIDAGTASEGGKLVGDLDPEIYHRPDLMAITPEKGGVGPLTVAVLFDNVIRSYKTFDFLG
ncbi:bifunctional 5,10-methylenetetrahydrofolate dehydrogenase/5,10-methenyltetrahydrofolate cyclohydrolase [Candidatus Saccharibacteria bacterium]|nr:bifunctional 5,10-methylenetetrahydrofolate dehydrogenase/5,10-methenyltetrahydrofolate cyclohydrolase [Candidatus Saccharibacteria bacterium]